MSGRMEKLLKAYPEMIQKRDCLAYQLVHFKGLSAEDVIDSMMTPKVDGERVKSSNLPDKTAQIALEYREKQARMNREWYAYLEKQLQDVTGEIVFLESAIRALPERYAELAWDLFIRRIPWIALAEKYHTCRSNIGKLRQKALRQLEDVYQQRIDAEIAYMLQ